MIFGLIRWFEAWFSAPSVTTYAAQVSAGFPRRGKKLSIVIKSRVPRSLVRKFANSDITNQKLPDKVQVRINGVDIGLNLRGDFAADSKASRERSMAAAWSYSWVSCSRGISVGSTPASFSAR